MSTSGSKTYLVRYRHDGAEWVLELTANNLDDAKARLAKLPYATIDGELVTKVPAALGPLAKMIVAIRNNLTSPLPPAP